MAARRNTSRKKSAKKKQQGNAEWSILLFGLGVLILALTYVPGEAAWDWMRSNLLFGVFGLATYAVGPLVLYLAVLVASGRPAGGAAMKSLLGVLLLCGLLLVFSKTELTGYSLNDGLVALHSASTQEWSTGGGVLSAVFGWSLLALCGRPGANILLVLLVLLSIMYITSVTPADLYRFFSGHAGRVKESLSTHSEDYAAQHAARVEARAQRLAEKQAQQAQQAEAAANNQAMRLVNTDRAPFDYDAFAAARANHNAQLRAEHASPTVDIDLGPEPQSASETEFAGQEKVKVGPGGTFGQKAVEEALHPTSPFVEPDAEFGAIITRRHIKTLSSGGAPVQSAFPAQENASPFVGAPTGPVSAAFAPTASGTAGRAAAPCANEIESLARKAAAPAAIAVESSGQTAIVQGENTGYAYPPLSLFQKQQQDNEAGIQEEMTHNADLLVKTLSSFGVQTRVLDISRGPSVTRYELQPLAGVKISRITGLADDIALNLATTGVRIEAPIPGKAAVGVEIPNKTRSMVSFRSILESPEFSKQTAPLAFAVGKDIAGHAQVGNLAKMPHLLIAGTTGSGKSVCTNSIIMSFLYRCPPEKLRLILIDPKMVEFAQYNGIPHLLMPVVTEPRKAAGALGSAVAEMEKRYHLLAENGVPNIEEYNALADKDDTLEPMPYVVIVIDELADLMMVAGKEVEDYICRLAQKARAAGMHLIVATQRPSVDVITGLIKANIPSRIGLSVMSQVDSRTILDTGGAEKLLGNGDMLYMPVGVTKPVRIQGAFIRSSEIRAVIDFLKKHAAANYNEEMIAEMEKRAVPEKAAEGQNEDAADAQDPMFATAVEVVLDAGQASTSLLQRRCKLGYARAARMMDEMEQAHIIGPYEGSKPRQVLISRQQWIEMTMRQPEAAGAGAPSV